MHGSSLGPVIPFLFCITLYKEEAYIVLEISFRLIIPILTLKNFVIVLVVSFSVWKTSCKILFINVLTSTYCCENNCILFIQNEIQCIL